MAAAEVAALRWPSGERVPTAAAVLEAVAHRFRHVTIDVKVAEQARTGTRK